MKPFWMQHMRDRILCSCKRGGKNHSRPSVIRGKPIKGSQKKNVVRYCLFLWDVKLCIFSSLHFYLGGSFLWQAQLLFSWNAAFPALRAIHICFSVMTQPRSYYQCVGFPRATSVCLCTNKPQKQPLGSAQGKLITPAPFANVIIMPLVKKCREKRRESPADFFFIFL